MAGMSAVANGMHPRATRNAPSSGASPLPMCDEPSREGDAFLRVASLQSSASAVIWLSVPSESTAFLVAGALHGPFPGGVLRYAQTRAGSTPSGASKRSRRWAPSRRCSCCCSLSSTACWESRQFLVWLKTNAASAAANPSWVRIMTTPGRPDGKLTMLRFSTEYLGSTPRCPGVG